MVAAVAHSDYAELSEAGLLARLKPGGVFADVKSSYDAVVLSAAGARVWRL